VILRHSEELIQLLILLVNILFCFALNVNEVGLWHDIEEFRFFVVLIILFEY
jgi:hypothetical protein